MCERPEIYADVERRARKAHWCRECRREIRAGATYHAISGLWDHSWSSFALCTGCADLRALVFAHGYKVECIVFGELFEHIKEEDIAATLANIPLASEEAVRAVGAALGLVYGVAHDDEDERFEAAKACYLETERRLGRSGYAQSCLRAMYRTPSAESC